MNVVEIRERYLVPIQRRWPIVLGAIVIGVVAAWLSLPGAPPTTMASGEPIEAGDAYRATHIMVRGRPSPATENFDLVAMIARQDAIVTAVDERLGDEAQGGAASSVTIEADDKLGTLSVSTVQPTPELASLVVSTYTEEITRHFDDLVQSAGQEQIESARSRLEATDARIQDLLDVQTKQSEGSLEWRLTESELSSLVDQYGRLQAEIGEISNSASLDAGSTFETIHDPDPVEVASEGVPVLDIPDNRGTRVVLIGLVATLLGLAVALGIDRFDTSLWTRKEAEEAFGLPVLALVPVRSRREQQADPVVVRSEPGSETGEAFRSLRLSVQLAPRWHLGRLQPTGSGELGSAEQVVGEWTPRTLLISSAVTGEGKSTVASNLAVSLSESGRRRVLVVDCDFRRATISTLLGVEVGPGLRDLGQLHWGAVQELLRPTDIPNVSVVSAGSPGVPPSWFLTDARVLVEQAKVLAEVVIFDTGPLLATTEAASLVPSVDTTLLVARSGKTSAASAKQATEQLSSLQAIVSGVVFVGVRRSRSYYYHEQPTRIHPPWKQVVR